MKMRKNVKNVPVKSRETFETLLEEHRVRSGWRASFNRCMEANEHGANLRICVSDSLHGANLRRKKLAGINLRERDLAFADLRRADLRRADLRRADLRRADLRGTIMKNSRVAGALFHGAKVGKGWQVPGWREDKGLAVTRDSWDYFHPRGSGVFSNP